MKNYTAIIAVALSLPVGFANAQQRDERPPQGNRIKWRGA